MQSVKTSFGLIEKYKLRIFYYIYIKFLFTCPVVNFREGKKGINESTRVLCYSTEICLLLKRLLYVNLSTKLAGDYLKCLQVALFTFKRINYIFLLIP